MDYSYEDDFYPPEQSQPDQVMAALSTHLFHAISVAKMWHWKVKSFSMHMALGDLYDQLTDLHDQLAEMYMGKYGTEFHIELSEPNPFSEQDPRTFIQQLASYLEAQHEIIPQDGWLVNKFEELQAAVLTAKYKLENLA